LELVQVAVMFVASAVRRLLCDLSGLAAELVVLPVFVLEA